mmetsp:Transcript_9257/g.25950  ORF Transcript_9257/g.25950 Transcript_9257/m.25950 type:complete len:210 (-) Transcript_9257:43-672(-)
MAEFPHGVVVREGAVNEGIVRISPGPNPGQNEDKTLVDTAHVHTVFAPALSSWNASQATDELRLVPRPTTPRVKVVIANGGKVGEIFPHRFVHQRLKGGRVARIIKVPRVDDHVRPPGHGHLEDPAGIIPEPLVAEEGSLEPRVGNNIVYSLPPRMLRPRIKPLAPTIPSKTQYLSAPSDHHHTRNHQHPSRALHPLSLLFSSLLPFPY